MVGFPGAEEAGCAWHTQADGAGWSKGKGKRAEDMIRMDVKLGIQKEVPKEIKDGVQSGQDQPLPRWRERPATLLKASRSNDNTPRGERVWITQAERQDG